MTKSLYDLTRIVHAARDAQLTHIITIGTTASDSEQAVACARAFPGMVYATVGLHPTEMVANWHDEMAILTALITQDKENHIKGIGECGIDLYRSPISLTEQQDRFRYQIELALAHHKALVIHSRVAADETLRCLDEFPDVANKAVMHCFSYDAAIAQELVQRNIAIGLGGSITYPKNEALRAASRSVPLNSIVLETDAPFLPPQQWRGQQNHPRYIPVIAQYLADLRADTLDTVAHTTTARARTLFNLTAAVHAAETHAS